MTSDIRTQKSPAGALNTMGQVVFFGGSCRLTILRTNMILPEPREAGSAMDSFWTSHPGLVSPGAVKSFVPSVRTVTPGNTHGFSGGGWLQGVGVTALQARPSPAALVAV